VSSAVVEVGGASGLLHIAGNTGPVGRHAEAGGGSRGNIAESMSGAVAWAREGWVNQATVNSSVSGIAGADTVEAFSMSLAVVGAVGCHTGTVESTKACMADAASLSALSVAAAPVSVLSASVLGAIFTTPAFLADTLTRVTVPVSRAVVDTLTGDKAEKDDTEERNSQHHTHLL